MDEEEQYYQEELRRKEEFTALFTDVVVGTVTIPPELNPDGSYADPDAYDDE